MENYPKELKKFLRYYQKGNFLFPSVLQRNFNLTKKKAEKIMESLSANNSCRKMYRVCCPYCHSSGNTFNKIEEIADNQECEHCSHEFNPTKNDIEYIYKIVNMINI